MPWCTALCIFVSVWLTDHHYSPAQRDAVLFYIHHESDFDPATIERSGACLVQWAGSRRRQILALGNGRCPSIETQLEFADHELRTIPNFRGFWTSSNPRWHMRYHFGQGH